LTAHPPNRAGARGNYGDEMVSGGANDGPLHVSICEDMILSGHAVVDAAARAARILGRPLTADELAQLEAARIRADLLAEEHGPDYRGFGNPTAT